MHASVHDPTWWGAKASGGVIDTKGLCIGFIEIVAHLGQYTVNLFVVLTILEFSPNDT